MTDPLGRTTEYLYDNLGRKVEEIDPDPANGADDTGSPRTYYGYDANGNLCAVEGPLGSPPSNPTDASTFDPACTTWHFFDGLNRQTCEVSALADLSYSYDTTPTTAQPDSEATTYNALGGVASTTDEMGRTTGYFYDNLGRKIEEVDPQVTVYPVGGGSGQLATPTTTISYDPDGNVVSTTDADGHTSWTDYDALNRAVKTVSAQGSGPNDVHYATTTVYDAVGNTLSVTDPDGNTTSYDYDRLNRPIETIDPLHNTCFDVYDLDGNVIQTTDADGRTIEYVYDPLNRQVEEEWLSPLPPGEGQGEGVLDPVIHSIQTYFDADGETLGVTETDTNNPANCTDYEYSYDCDGNVLTSRMAPGGLAQTPQTVDTYTTDTLSTSSATADWNNGPAAEPYKGYSISLTAGEVVTVALVSSAFEPVAFAQAPGGNAANWLVNQGGLGGGNAWLMFTVGTGQAGTWLIGATSSSATASGGYSLTITADTHPMVPDALAELDYAYYADGSVHTLTDSSTVVSGESGQITYGYDAVGDTTQITDENAAGSSGITAKHVELAYNPDGSPDTITRYNGATVQPADVVATTEYRTTAGSSTPGSGYDADGRLVAMQQTFGSTTQPYTWQYDAAANITQEVSSDGTNNYALDSADQLKTASLNTEGYSYDQNGNRVGGGYVTGANNRLLSDGTYKYTYDKDGNLIKRTRIFDAGWWISDYETDYTWDYENRLISVTYKNDTGLITKSIICGYDFAGRLISTATQSVSGGGFSYEYSVYDGSNELLAFSDSTALGGSGTPSLLTATCTGRPSIKSWQPTTTTAAYCGAWRTRKARSGKW